jgi:hypothetical protein
MWLTAGLVLGVMHASEIWRAARRPSVATTIVGLMRLLVVGLVLTAAAILGEILPAAAGWAVGFFASVAVRSRGRQILAAIDSKRPNSGDLSYWDGDA